MVDVLRSSQNSAKNNSPRLFTPLTTRGVEYSFAGGASNQTTDGTFTENTSAGEKDSFTYEGDIDGIKSTQQLKVDWSDFAQHTFFQSAQVKVNTALDLILNEYPFDGTQKATELFLDQLTGYERWVFNNFPKYEGYLNISGTQPSDTTGGTFVVIPDIAGTTFPGVSRVSRGNSLLNPGTSSLMLEFQLRLPEQGNYNQYVLDKHIGTTLGDSEGWAVTIQSGSSTTYATMSFHGFQEGKYTSVNAVVPKGQWNHIAFIWDRGSVSGSLKSVVNLETTQTSSNFMVLNEMLPNTQSLYIGTGSAISTYFVPEQTFSGSIDELRIWHKTKTVDQMKQDRTKTIFAQENLVAYYRFDEAMVSASADQSTVVIDSSGNELHGELSAYAILGGVRTISTASIGFSSPMTNARLSFLPVLFPKSPDVIDYAASLAVGASEYDEKNPSLITKLVPRHYFEEGQKQEGMDTEVGTIIDTMTSGVDPRSSVLGGTQAFILLLYTWAKFFDEIKLFSKGFKDMGWVDYDQTGTSADAFLKNYAKELGIELPAFFQNADIKQFIYGDNIDNSISLNEYSLQSIQNTLWRRLLTNMPEILKSKGTTYALKQYVRSLGMEPDSIFRIREYGGASKKSLQHSREDKVETFFFADFMNQTGSYLYSSPPMNRNGARTEPGWPIRDNTYNTNATNSFLSGSWTFEGMYKLYSDSAFYSQSLVRFEVGKDTTVLDRDVITANLVASDEGALTLYYRDNIYVGDSILSMSVPANLYDGDVWHLSFGRRRWDDNTYDDLNSVSSSLFFLRAAKKMGNEIIESYEETKWHDDRQKTFNGVSIFPPLNVAIVNPYNLSGSYLVIGNKPVVPSSVNSVLSFSTSIASNPTVALTDFDGRVAELRMYSEYIPQPIWKEHIKNPRSVGVSNPVNNWNFDFTSTGSWQRLRHQFSFDQPEKYADGSGEFVATDFSQLPTTYFDGDQTKYKMLGYGFEADSLVLKPIDMVYTQISPKFDSSVTSEKIRIRGFNSTESIENPWEQFGPAYDIELSETPTDNTKISIDFSVIDALDKDIMTIFGNLDEFDNALGAPENQFEESYPQIDAMRRNYFNKLETKLNLRGFFEFYKWFDTNFGSYLLQLLPYNAKFNGTNYVIESHMLERGKFVYKSDDVYVGEGNRDYTRAQITVQFIAGTLGRF